MQRSRDCPTRGAGQLTESHTRKPESELAEKLLKVEKAAQNAVIKEIMADFGLEGATKKRLIRLIGNNDYDWRMIGYRLKRALIAET